jgi:protein required for attachment to host cells
MKFKHGTWVIVCDAGKFLLLENNGDQDAMDLRVVDHEEVENPRTSEQGTARPGRFQMTSDRRGSTVEADWHALGEIRFAEDLAGRLDRWAGQDRFDGLVIVADSRTMGVLRTALSDQVKMRVLAEIQKDYAHRTIEFIEDALAKA